MSKLKIQGKEFGVICYTNGPVINITIIVMKIHFTTLHHSECYSALRHPVW